MKGLEQGVLSLGIHTGAPPQAEASSFAHPNKHVHQKTVGRPSIHNTLLQCFQENPGFVWVVCRAWLGEPMLICRNLQMVVSVNRAQI